VTACGPTVKRRLTILIALSESRRVARSAIPESSMRMPIISLTAIFCAAFATSVRAEQHMFIVANDSDGYGIDRCLATGDTCGAAAANAYCKTQAFAAAANYRKVNRIEITGATADSNTESCVDSGCNMVAIVCTR
jgi:hypothetical protein